MNLKIRLRKLAIVSSLLGVVMQSTPAQPVITHAQKPTSVTEEAVPWWKKAVMYQVYLRSFKDLDNDGVGDINGLISKLDYLKELGVDAIWISPHYRSPNKDNGYDVSSYRAVQKGFGTIKDFDRLVAELDKRHIRLIIDAVINHSSDQHKWFKASRHSLYNRYRDYYIWMPNKDNRPPNNYLSFLAALLGSLIRELMNTTYITT